MKKIILVLLFIFSVAIGIRFWFGVYIHDEFGDTELFMKHRPIWKWKFYSPINMSDLKLEDLSKEKREEQLLFNEFITNQGLSR